MTSPFITANGLGTLLSLHHSTVAKYLTALKVPRIRIGKRVYYRITDVQHHFDLARGAR